MRLKFNKIINQFLEISYNEFLTNPKKVCNKLVNTKIEEVFTKPDNIIDIVEFIQELNNNFKNEEYVFIAETIDGETLFKEEQIKKAIEIIKIKEKKEQFSRIYDEVYDYLDRDFISNKYCDFIDNKCVAQRHKCFYPINSKNGCCFMSARKCIHLQENGNCNVRCLACRLFSCTYLTQKGVGYWAKDIVLLKAFYSKEKEKN